MRFSHLSSRVVLADVPEPTAGSGSEVVLPLEKEFDFWSLLPGGGYLTVASAAELGLFELEVGAYGVAGEGRDVGFGSVEALDLVTFDAFGVNGNVPLS